ncbi:hypothetical protein DL770_011684 [Monosporascus sp. CRB-9-2]|nr:hypothetical protein DL770_011684 [Monosporascus sp. CRB-9-2]
MEDGFEDGFLERAYSRIRQAASVSTASPARTLPRPEAISAARASLPSPNDPNYLKGRGVQATLDHMLGTLVPAFNGQNLSGRYWGFVTGSTLPIAEMADNVVSAYDQNVHVHLPEQSISTEVEDAALRMLLHLLDLGDPSAWEGRTFTTGATASNILGLACGREAVLSARLPPGSESVGELGLLRACALARVEEIQVLTSMGHSSIPKAASIVGLGRASVKDLPYSDEEPWRLDLDAVERELRQDGVANIISVSAGEVNTGRFATTGFEEMKRLRELADRYGAWIHVDGGSFCYIAMTVQQVANVTLLAFGLFARILPETSEFARLRSMATGLELADSITLDGHKLLNVPYDNGVFFTRKASTLTSACKNPNAAYLSGSASCEIQSPLDVGLENSRRFRALPVYAALVSEGREGLAAMVARMVRLARAIARVVQDSEHYALLAGGDHGEEDIDLEDVNVVVLFRAKDDALNEVLVDRIHRTGEWYVSGTKWKGQTACRVAVASWRADVEEDARHVERGLAAIAAEHFATAR